MKKLNDKIFVFQFVNDLFTLNNTQLIKFFNFFQIFNIYFDITILNIYDNNKNVFVFQKNSQLVKN